MSDIFDEYARIALKNGLIKNAEEDSKKSKEALEKNPRAGSDDMSTIELLYGVKPKPAKDMDYKRNIIEIAHPETVIISPAHDKINGRMGNGNENQDTVINSLKLKQRSGNAFHKKYADQKQKLLLSLIKAANTLEKTNNEKLICLADDCAIQLNKKAAVPVAGVVVGTIAAIVGLIYLQQHTDQANQGFQINSNDLKSELQDFLDSNTNYGVGKKYKESFLNQIKDFISKLNEMQSAVNEVSSIVDELQKPKTATELKEFANNKSYKARIEHYKKLKEKIEELSPYINQMLNNFKSEDFKKNQIEESGWLTKQIDKARVFHGGKGLIADDFDDVVRSMSPYMESLKYIESVLNTSNNIEDNVKQKLSTTENKKEQPVKEEDPFKKHFSL